MDDAESSIAHLEALANPGFANSLSSPMSGTGVKSVDERGGVVQVTVDMTVSGAIGAWDNFATGLPAPTRSLYWQGWSYDSDKSYKLRLDTTGALGVRTRGGTYIDTTLTYIAAE